MGTGETMITEIWGVEIGKICAFMLIGVVAGYLLRMIDETREQFEGRK